MNKLLMALMVTASLAGCAGMGMGGGPGGEPKRTAGEAVDDITIGTRIKAALVADPDLSALKINVDTTQGHVRLKGEVKNITLWRKAESIARGVPGVKSVDNQLLITG